MLLTIFGVTSAAIMITSYALERRSPRWIAVFAAGCASTAVYGVLSGAPIFAALETIWAAIAVGRWRTAVRDDDATGRWSA